MKKEIEQHKHEWKKIYYRVYDKKKKKQIAISIENKFICSICHRIVDIK